MLTRSLATGGRARRIVAIGITLTILAFIGAAAPAGQLAMASSPSPNQGEMVFGALLTLTEAGDVDTRAALEIAVEEINAYLSSSGSGARVRLVVEGTAYDPASALEKLMALARQDIRVVIGPETSAEAAATKAFADQAGIVLISHCSTAPSLAVAGDNIFRFVPDDTNQAVALARMMAEDRIKAIVPLWRADPFGDDLTAATKRGFEALGGRQLAGVRFDPDDEDLSAELESLSSQVQQARAEYGTDAVAVHLLAFGTDVVTIFHEAERHPALAGVRWYGSEGTAQSRELVGDEQAARFAMTVGFSSTVFGEAETSKTALVTSKIRQRVDGPPHVCALAAYDALWAAALTSLATGGTENAAAFKATLPLTAGHYFGATGWTSLNAAGDRDAADYDVWAIRETDGALRWVRVARFQAGPDGGKLVR